MLAPHQHTVSSQCHEDEHTSDIYNLPPCNVQGSLAVPGFYLLQSYPRVLRACCRTVEQDRGKHSHMPGGTNFSSLVTCTRRLSMENGPEDMLVPRGELEVEATQVAFIDDAQ